MGYSTVHRITDFGSFLGSDVLFLATGPRFRYWVPSGNIDPDFVRRDVEEMAAKGFGGAQYLEQVDAAVLLVLCGSLIDQSTV